MKKKLFFALVGLIFCTIEVNMAQDQVYIGDAVAGSAALTESKYINLIGSPFYSDGYLPGVVKLGDGKIYKDLKLKYDQIKDKLFFLGDKGQDMAFLLPVLEFKFVAFADGEAKDVYFVNGYDSIDDATKKSYYQKLNFASNPKVQFLKRMTKKIYETRVYNSAVTDRTVEQQYSYYFFKNSKLLKIKLDKKIILAAIGDRQDELEKFMIQNKLSWKSERDLMLLLKYYSEL